MFCPSRNILRGTVACCQGSWLVLLCKLNIKFLFSRGFGNCKEKVIAFRECFVRLGELRSLIPCCTPVLALTATAAQRTKEEVTKALSLRPDRHEIIVSPDRPNIYLYKAKVNDTC